MITQFIITTWPVRVKHLENANIENIKHC